MDTIIQRHLIIFFIDAIKTKKILSSKLILGLNLRT